MNEEKELRMFASVKVRSGSSAAAGADVLVVGLFNDKRAWKGLVSLAGGEAAVVTSKRAEFSGECGSVVDGFVDLKGGRRSGPTRVVVFGLGDRGSLDEEQLTSACAAAGRRLAGIQGGNVRVELAGALEEAGVASAERAGFIFGEAMGLLGWNYDYCRGSATTKAKRPELSLSGGDTAFVRGMDRGVRLAESVNLARDLSQAPPNLCTTTYVADACRELARKTPGLSCTVIEGGALEREGLTGLRIVGSASEHPPRLVRLEYTPGGGGGRKKSSGKPLVLVGKTLTYDSGGLSIKPMPGMAGMKRDMDGGAAVIGAMHAIATVVKPKERVVALLAVAENAISGNAYRPDDVLTFRNGVTVEVTNTDAEGRLVLADALCWACDKEDPGAIVDVATLTGGVVVALGSTYAGLFCEDDALRGRLDTASATSRERLWRLPMHREYREMMRSPVADILNSNPNRKAHPIQGAAFLSYFVKAGVPWAHVDIAGVHVAESDSGPFVKGPNGFGVRLLADLVGSA